jgi:hypothetical protein
MYTATRPPDRIGLSRLIRGISRYRDGQLPLNISLVVLLCGSTACGQRRLERPPGLVPPQDTASAILPGADSLGSVVVVNVQVRKPTGSKLGYRVYRYGGDRDETFYWPPVPRIANQFGCSIRDLLHSTLRDRGGQAASLDSQTLNGRSGGDNCSSLSPTRREQLAL